MTGLLEGKKLLEVQDVKPGDRIVVCEAESGEAVLHVHIASGARYHQADYLWQVDVEQSDGSIDTVMACALGLIQDCSPSRQSNYVAILDDSEE